MNCQMRKVIVNSTPLIILSNAQSLSVLKSVYNEITIPKAVFDEVTAKEDSACNELRDNLDWIHIENISNEASKRMYQAKLHAGEVEVMILAQETNAELVILDDNAAKKTAKFLGLTVTGTLGVLLKAKNLGIIPSIKPIIDRIRDNGFFITDDIYNLVLNKAGEIN